MGGGLNAKEIEGKYEAELEFLRGRRILEKIPSVGVGGGGMDIFWTFTLTVNSDCIFLP